MFVVEAKKDFICKLLLFYLIVSKLSFAAISDDAMILTFRIQDGIILDTSLAEQFDSLLAALRLEYDTLKSISAHPDYVYTELVVKTSPPYSEQWRSNKLLCGNDYVDSLSLKYNLIAVDTLFLNWFILTFAHPVQVEKLARSYSRDSSLFLAEPNDIIIDGDDIIFFQKDAFWHFAFKKGWGSCTEGCIYEYYWYTTVNMSQSNYIANLVDSGFGMPPSSASSPLYRWNIPDRYAMTGFPNVDSIFNAILYSQDWWIRKHAIEGVCRLFIKDGPWVTEDLNDQWYALKDELMSRNEELLSIINEARSDIDSFVKVSAEQAFIEISQILSSEIDLSKYQNKIKRKRGIVNSILINPKDDIASIHYYIGDQRNISINVYNLQGRSLFPLVNSYHTKGSYIISWHYDKCYSGKYFIKLTSKYKSELYSIILF
ncbi:MAG: T9SS type A sorting domain-containing protein [Chitinivibrionales bacterium]|nr:T9SS type A sorting domain-containing protein [Chitinivibrionales bacterium]